MDGGFSIRMAFGPSKLYESTERGEANPAGGGGADPSGTRGFDLPAATGPADGPQMGVSRRQGRFGRERRAGTATRARRGIGDRRRYRQPGGSYPAYLP